MFNNNVLIILNIEIGKYILKKSCKTFRFANVRNSKII